MSGDARCPHCGAPQPARGQMEHGRTCPLATDRFAARFREMQKRKKRKAKKPA